ncbi:MAG: hypothetical protein GW947_03485 [Candidatus Pacebacteria bacterium]|nr:hypothetical protein [Candidatus Paceibacterota bacterium]PIR59821.1 MAG: hypothetical protein COU68_03575 [Candidatus Pacebacteria bacterium CG10_big_fil_rev_8_21_14_0_10_45_6]
MIKGYQKATLFLTALLLSAAPSTIFASGTSLGVVRSGDSMYLSTQAASSSATSSAYPQGDIVLYKGYSPDIGTLITSILTIVMLLCALLVLLQLVTAAFAWMTSGGDKGKTGEARSKIVAAVIGLVIVAASWAIFIIVLKFLGFTSYEDLFNNVRPISG